MRRIHFILFCVLVCTQITNTSRLPKRYETEDKDSLERMIKVLQHLATTSGETNAIHGTNSRFAQDQTEHLNGFKPYKLFLAIKTKDETAEGASNSKEQTTDKRVANGVDYWLGGGRFGKRFGDYGLTKTRFGRSMDHVDVEDI